MEEIILDELSLEHPVEGANVFTPRGYDNIAIFQVYDGSRCFDGIMGKGALEDTMEEVQGLGIEGVIVDFDAVDELLAQMSITIRLWGEFDKMGIGDGYVGLSDLQGYLEGRPDPEDNILANKGLYDRCIKPKVYDSIEDAVSGLRVRLE